MSLLKILRLLNSQKNKMPYALKNKKTGRLLCVEPQKGLVDCGKWEEPYETLLLKLSDTGYEDIIFLTSKKWIAYSLKKTGKSSFPNIEIDLDKQGFGSEDIELKNIEVVLLRVKRKNSSAELERKKFAENMK